MSDEPVGGHVSYTRSAFTRAGFIGGGSPLLFEVPPQHLAPALKALEVAIEVCNDHMESLEARGLWARIDAPVQTPSGPMAIVTECEPGRALTAMLKKLAESLELQGVSGRLVPGRTAEHPLFDYASFPALGALMFLPVDEQDLIRSYDRANRGPSRPRWGVAAGVTQPVVAHVLRWATQNGGDVYVRVGPTQFRLDADQVHAFVMSTLPSEATISVKAVASERRLRGIRFSALGGVSLTHFDLDAPRESVLTELIDAVRPIAGIINGALVREMHTRGFDRESLRRTPPRAPILEAIGAAHWLISHLEGDYVLDACVAQVLTPTQLAKTASLPAARWEVTNLGDDRHLVVHRSPQLWFDCDDVPLSERPALASPVSPDVVQQARSDFGSAIMTAQTVRAFPPALPADELTRVFPLYGLD